MPVSSRVGFSPRLLILDPSARQDAVKSTRCSATSSRYVYIRAWSMREVQRPPGLHLLDGTSVSA